MLKVLAQWSVVPAGADAWGGNELAEPVGAEAEEVEAMYCSFAALPPLLSPVDDEERLDSALVVTANLAGGSFTCPKGERCPTSFGAPSRDGPGLGERDWDGDVCEEDSSTGPDVSRKNGLVDVNENGAPGGAEYRRSPSI